jgi:hypothetical protein
MHTPLGSVGVAAPDRRGVLAGLAPYDSVVDLTIVRALAPAESALSLVARAAAPSAAALSADE